MDPTISRTHLEYDLTPIESISRFAYDTLNSVVEQLNVQDELADYVGGVKWKLKKVKIVARAEGKEVIEDNMIVTFSLMK